MIKLTFLKVTQLLLCSAKLKHFSLQSLFKLIWILLLSNSVLSKHIVYSLWRITLRLFNFIVNFFAKEEGRTSSKQSCGNDILIFRFLPSNHLLFSHINYWTDDIPIFINKVIVFVIILHSLSVVFIYKQRLKNCFVQFLKIKWTSFFSVFFILLIVIYS